MQEKKKKLEHLLKILKPQTENNVKQSNTFFFKYQNYINKCSNIFKK